MQGLKKLVDISKEELYAAFGCAYDSVWSIVGEQIIDWDSEKNFTEKLITLEREDGLRVICVVTDGGNCMSWGERYTIHEAYEEDEGITISYNTKESSGEFQISMSEFELMKEAVHAAACADPEEYASITQKLKWIK